MSAVDALSAVALTRPTPTLAPAETQARMRQTAEEFEASFLSQMLQPMFEGLSTDGPFGGGQAEGTWRSFMLDAMGKQMARHGGVGLSDGIYNELLKMQGMTDRPVTPEVSPLAAPASAGAA